ncbi:probable LRR receptor-like serine/threonine-protein kinase RFK1 isoform X2 [Chenopodium quinoa]|uniref:probable LRR receptor-like serine/threonine-protein kinase RFK1 isoform X2 n=1 Tax=Chenopodium quinoa TaxID=63459 RepID=UPI000B76F833|nr:probable LRR receptor-like serine/threonine-protein kinase RFK1 isoform X2 [Chenopodium quinoa]
MAKLFGVLIIFLGFLLYPLHSRVHENEVVALQEIFQILGAKYWKFDNVSCQVELAGATPQSPLDAESEISCDCHQENNTCHVVRIFLKRYSLPGVLPRELVKLPYLREVDFAYNYLSGGIPVEWASLQLEYISLLSNRLSGEIPKELGKIGSLTTLSLEANQFSGKLPDELGELVNLKTLVLSSNDLRGTLPRTFAGLTNLSDLRINDNNFNGIIPHYIENWKQLQRLEMHASGLQGPIPSSISFLDGLTEFDINGSIQNFPDLRNMTGLVRLVLRNCSIAGELPVYLWDITSLKMIDVSLNNLVGEIPNDINVKNVKFIFLTGNTLSGNVPSSLLQDGRNIDLSYNNFTWQSPEQPSCRKNMNLNLNLFRSSSTGVSLKGLLPCSNSIDCPRYGCSLHVNCGGDDFVAEDEDRKVVYEGDGGVGGGVATYYMSSKNNWGFSATGDFMDDDDLQSIRHTKYLPGSNLSDLYATARISPVTLTYFTYCLENGNYTVKLHFAEIQFTNNKTYYSLGRRFFDIYIQDKLVQKDFNIEDKAHGAQKPTVIVFNSSVTDNILEIRLNWAGKGTTRIPTRGVYGPLISAISVNPVSRQCSSGRSQSSHRIIYITLGIVSFFFLILAVLILWWKGCFRVRTKSDDLGGLQIQGGGYTLKQIRTATNNFNPSNKIGEGGFGPVYKGLMHDGTVIAVKQLSSKSKQGNHEFLNEIGMISCLQHTNLVKLHGFCIEGDQLLLVYEYMENNCLARALFGHEQSQIFLDWEKRVKICLGISRGLAFLHEDSRLKIVHRDIKATNVLLDRELNPKISDFGLARLGEDEKTHVSTRVAGTIGYMAPEYAIWGHLSYKVDVYSFGIVTLEIISGRSNSYYVPSTDFFCLLDWACHLRTSGNYVELVDQRLGCNYNIEEAETMVNVALLCTSAAASERPTMSEVVKMLEGEMAVPDVVPDFQAYTNDVRFKSIRGKHPHREAENVGGRQSEISTTMHTETLSSSTSSQRVH